MDGCQQCKELEDALEHLAAKYWAASGRNQQLVSTDPEKREAQVLELTAKDAVDEGWKLFEDHKQSAHPDVVE
jgi:hypothetical protein